jgi:hypothetical protein
MKILDSILIKPLVFIGPSEYRGHSFFGVLRFLFRIVLVLVLAELLTLVTYSKLPMFDLPTAKSVHDNYLKQVNDSLESAEIEEELQGLMNADLVGKIKFLICPAVESKTNTNCYGSESDSIDDDAKKYSLRLVCDTCDEQQAAIIKSKDIIFNVKSVAHPGIFLGAVKAISGYRVSSEHWPINQVEFFGGPFVATSLLLEMAETKSASNESAKTLTSQAKEKIRSVIDSRLSFLPSPSSSEFVYPRRLVGFIQVVTLYFFYIALILCLLTYLVKVLPNRLLRGWDSWEGTSFISRVEVVDSGNDSNGSSEVSNITNLTPWRYYQSGLSGDVEDYLKTYQNIGSYAEKKYGWLGCFPLFPLLEFREIGFLALKTSSTGANVPTFVSVAADAHAERLEANSKIFNYLIWAIPTLGFIGTVLGIGDALLSTVDLQSGVLSTRSLAESQVGTRIGVAFDTTFVSLILSFILMFLNFLLQRSEESMLSIEKRDTMKEILRSGIMKENADLEQMMKGLLKLGYTAKKMEMLIGRAEGVYRPGNVDDRANNANPDGSVSYIALFLILFIIITIAGVMLFYIYPEIYTAYKDSIVNAISTMISRLN